MGVAPGPDASPQTPANSTIRADPFVRALICSQSRRSTWRTLSGAPRQGAVWGHRVLGDGLGGFRDAIPRESVHTTAFIVASVHLTDARTGVRLRLGAHGVVDGVTTLA